MELKNNTILITGGTSGIGYELGKKLLAFDNVVILLGRNKDKLEKAKNKGFETIECDLSKQEEIEQAVMRIQSKYPQINMLFNNAGIQFNYSFTDNVIPIDKIGKEINTNITGQIVLTQLLIPLLSNAKGSFIINTTSGLGAFPKSDGLVYSATKAAMRNFTVGLRYALKETSIKVIEFIPPVTDTGMTHGRSEDKMTPQELVQKILPQLQREKEILTITKMRLFLWIAFLFPSMANKILSKA